MSDSVRRKIRFVDSGPGGAAFNMALDEVLIDSVQNGDYDACVRAYAWDSDSVSLGHNQLPADRLDFIRCREENISAVRRLTGGREVYHDRNELTYSVCGPLDTDWLGKTINETYLRIAKALNEMLLAIGLETDMEKYPAKPVPGHEGMKNPCFNSVSRYEISWQGRKMIGSAQRRFLDNGVFLQQGSVLVTNSQYRLAEISPGNDNSKRRLAISRMMKAQAVGIDEALGRVVPYSEMTPALKNGFGKAFACEIVEQPASEQEITRAKELAATDYPDPTKTKITSVK